MKARCHASAFTLIEVLAVVLMTSVVIGVALDFYIDLSRASQRATDHTRTLRRATSILDRVARDFESVMLAAKEPETDPLAHPWVFLGESRGSEFGADRLKFVIRGNRPRGTARHESDLAMVAYTVRQAEDGEGLELMRWSSPHLPESLDRDFPGDESQGAVLLAEGLAEFGVRFIGEDGELASSWDSSTLVDSSELPVAVEIELALVEDEDANEEVDAPQSFRRTVILPVRPLSFQELFDPSSPVNGGSGNADAEDEDQMAGMKEGCLASPCASMTVCQAVNCGGKLGQYGQSIDQLLTEALEASTPFCDWQPFVSKSLRWLIDNPSCR